MTAPPFGALESEISIPLGTVVSLPGPLDSDASIPLETVVPTFGEPGLGDVPPVEAIVPSPGASVSDLSSPLEGVVPLPVAGESEKTLPLVAAVSPLDAIESDVSSPLETVVLPPGSFEPDGPAPLGTVVRTTGWPELDGSPPLVVTVPPLGAFVTGLSRPLFDAVIPPAGVPELGTSVSPKAVVSRRVVRGPAVGENPPVESVGKSGLGVMSVFVADGVVVSENLGTDSVLPLPPFDDVGEPCDVVLTEVCVLNLQRSELRAPGDDPPDKSGLSVVPSSAVVPAATIGLSVALVCELGPVLDVAVTSYAELEVDV